MSKAYGKAAMTRARTLIGDIRAVGKDPRAMSDRDMRRYIGCGPRTVMAVRDMLDLGGASCPHCGCPLPPTEKEQQ